MHILQNALERKLKKITKLKELANYYKPCNLVFTVQKVMGAGIGEEYYDLVDVAKVKDNHAKEPTEKMKIMEQLKSERNERGEEMEDDFEETCDKEEGEEDY